jgi:hypothetical protein
MLIMCFEEVVVGSKWGYVYTANWHGRRCSSFYAQHCFLALPRLLNFGCVQRLMHG